MLLGGTLLASLLLAAHASHHADLHGGSGAQNKGSDGVRRVAVIGAGAGGTSTAYHIRKFALEAGIPANITVFERNSYIGGRTTTVHAYGDPGSEAIELGGSIFVEVNHILVRAVDEFNLTSQFFRPSSLSEGLAAGADGDGRKTREKLAAVPQLGIWNGKEFILTQSASNRWWDTAKLLWRYGLAPIRTNNLMKRVVGKFLQMYEPPFFPWPSLSQAAYDLGLTAVTAATGEQYLAENEVGDLFAREVVQASTRVNYASNLAGIHGLEALVCMATDGAMSVEGGNWQIFAAMAKSATPDLRLGQNVTAVQRQEDGTYVVQSKACDDDQHTGSVAQDSFDSVVLAAPLQFSGIELDPLPRRVPDAIPYVELHVTLFTSQHLLSPAAFNLPPDSAVPEIVLTTLQPGEQPGDGPARVGEAGFFSISLLRPVVNPHNSRHEFAYKIFSPVEVDAAFLSRILGLEESEGGGLDVREDDVSWVYRKVWHSYPYEYPRVTFEALKLDEDLWYTSGIESFISTMETSALMGKNIARLLVDEWVQSGAGEPVEDAGQRAEQQPLQAEL